MRREGGWSLGTSLGDHMGVDGAHQIRLNVFDWHNMNHLRDEPINKIYHALAWYNKGHEANPRK